METITFKAIAVAEAVIKFMQEREDIPFIEVTGSVDGSIQVYLDIDLIYEDPNPCRITIWQNHKRSILCYVKDMVPEEAVTRLGLLDLTYVLDTIQVFQTLNPNKPSAD